MFIVPRIKRYLHKSFDPSHTFVPILLYPSIYTLASHQILSRISIVFLTRVSFSFRWSFVALKKLRSNWDVDWSPRIESLIWKPSVCQSTQSLISVTVNCVCDRRTLCYKARAVNRAMIDHVAPVASSRLTYEGKKKKKRKSIWKLSGVACW